MHYKPISILGDVLIASVAGGIVAVASIPFSVIALLFFVAAVFFTVHNRQREGQPRLAACGGIAATFVLISLVTAAAAYQPTKIVEQQLDRIVTLPSTRMTLAELSNLATHDPLGFPIPVSFCFADEDKDVSVEWPGRELTLRNFLDVIESQTVLRRHFMHCGNGYTVLGGGDCSFGLCVRDPELVHPPFSRECFDVDDYALRRDAI